jgi:hypothetical protein
MRLVNRFLFFVSIALFVLSPALCRQGPTTPKQEGPVPAAFAIQLKYVKLDFPRRTNTCIAVFSDGRFHLEKAWSGSFPDSGSQIFEGSLDRETLKSLSAILAAEDFRRVGTFDVGQMTNQGQIIWAIIPRSEETQEFFLVGRAGMPTQYPKPLPASTKPLIVWLEKTGKAIEKQKIFLIKRPRPVNCWLPTAWPTTIPAQQAQAQGGVASQDRRSETASTPNSPATGDQSLKPLEEKKLYSNTATFVNSSADELLETIPELRGLKPVQNQEELAGLLGRIGDKAVGLLQKMPNLICHEKVTEARQGRQLGRLEFDYLILAHHTSEAVSLEEYRVDLRDKLLAAPNAPDVGTATVSVTDLRRKSDEVSSRHSGGPPLSEGFSYKWVHFYPSNRSESTFRYLGRQKIDGHKTLVVAFAQKPGSVRLPGQLRFQDKVIPIFYQGIAWVDESDSRIVRLRTDLLAPVPDAHLRRLTAEIHFGEVHLEDSSLPLWLPREVRVKSDVNGQRFEEWHVYSAYRAYSVQSKIVLGP